MKAILLLISIFVLTELQAQIPEIIIDTVSIHTRNNETIFIYGELDATKKDSILVTVEKRTNGKSSIIQSFLSPCSYPYEIKSTTINGVNGILITYDPAAKHGNSFLYLFNDNLNKLQIVEGYKDLGMVKTIKYANRTYFYSYTSCGCADKCWRSILFDIQSYHLDTLAYLSCDCEQLIEINENENQNQNKRISLTCDFFNNDRKFEKIEDYWKGKTKNGL